MNFPDEQSQARHELNVKSLIMNALETAGEQTEDELTEMILDYERAILRYGVYQAAIEGEVGVFWDEDDNDIRIQRSEELTERLKETIGHMRQMIIEEN